MPQAPQTEIEELMAVLAAGGGDDDVAAVERVLTRWPDDPRLLFMKGSLLASSGRAVEAHGTLKQAVTLDPEFAIARFQLGLFELTSGDAGAALSTLGPLFRLSQDHPLRRFVEGLTHMIRDEFDEAITQLERGVALNQENQPLNHDMMLLADQCRRLIGGKPPSDGASSPASSATSLILGQYSKTRH